MIAADYAHLKTGSDACLFTYSIGCEDDYCLLKIYYEWELVDSFQIHEELFENNT